MTRRPTQRPDGTTAPTRRTAGLLAAALLALTTVAVLAAASPAPVAAAEGTGTGPNGQTLTVSDVDGLDPTGATVTVTGAGFDAAAAFDVDLHGLYLSLCVDNGPGQQPSPCLGGVDQTGETHSTRWITNNPLPGAEVTPIGADGSFTTTLDIAATDGFTDCFDLAAEKECVVVTRRDHRGGGDRSQDVKVPVTWGASLTVTPAASVDAAGTDLVVTGTGYPTTPPGLYVVFGPEDGSTTDAELYQSLAFVPSSQMVDGTFTVTLEGVTARYTDGHGDEQDLLHGGGAVSTFRAHGAPDTEGDWLRRAPVSFARRTATESFVEAAHVDFLGRPGTDQEIAAGVAALAGGQSRTQLLRSLSTSDEWLEAVVDQLYVDTLGREGDESGTAFWVGRLERGESVARVAAQLYASGEYFDGIGGGTNASWIDDLYTKILGRSADDSGRTFWVAETVAKGRGSVALRFFQSGESARTRVEGLYQRLLGRSADASGLDHWAGRVVREGDLALSVHLAGSAEYAVRSVTRYP